MTSLVTLEPNHPIALWGALKWLCEHNGSFALAVPDPKE